MNPNFHTTPSKFISAWYPFLAVASWVAVALGLALLFGVWLPRRTNFKALKKQANVVSAQLTEASRYCSVTEMQRHIAQEQAAESQLHVEMAYWIERRNTFSCSLDTPPLPTHQDEGRIDFKIALFNARTNLLALAVSKNARIPLTLGIDETLSASTRVETARSQLSATVRLVQRVLETGIQVIDRIQPLTPRMKTLQNDTFSRLREYPIALDVQGSFEQCMELLSLLADSDNGYALQHLSLEKTANQIDNTTLSLRLVVTAGRPLPPQPPSRPDSGEDSTDPLPDSGSQRRVNAKGRALASGGGGFAILTHLSMAENQR